MLTYFVLSVDVVLFVLVCDLLVFDLFFLLGFYVGLLIWYPLMGFALLVGFY